MRCVVLVCLLVAVGCEENEPPFFNGKDLAGWEFVPAKAKDAFTVKDKVIVCAGRPIGYMRTIDRYEEFNEEVRVRVGDRASEEAARGGGGHLEDRVAVEEAQHLPAAVARGADDGDADLLSHQSTSHQSTSFIRTPTPRRARRACAGRSGR